MDKEIKETEESKKHRAYVLKLETELHEIEKREEAATRRMQLLVYPATIAFIILSAYGFYLVNSLTADVGRMAKAVDVMSQTVHKNMDIIAGNTIKMSRHMGSLIDSTSKMNQQVKHMSLHTQHMSSGVEQMAIYTGHMQQDLWSLNKNISKPFDLFNKFIPWSGDSNQRRFIPSQNYTYYYPVYYKTPTQSLIGQQHAITDIVMSTKY